MSSLARITKTGLRIVGLGDPPPPPAELPEIRVTPINTAERGSFGVREDAIGILARLNTDGTIDFARLEEGYKMVRKMVVSRVEVIDGSITSAEYVKLLSEDETRELLRIIIGLDSDELERSPSEVDPATADPTPTPSATSEPNSSSGSPRANGARSRAGSLPSH